ncbi:MAG: glutamate--cysteine ligase [Acetobacteraceae bacterium]|nr:glutamate--cysteine ligase [Acetobacteraceae bacterium]
MSNPGDADDTPIASVQQLADYIAGGCKPPSEYRIGTEHEKFGFGRESFRPPPYEPDGIRALLERMAQPGLWEPIVENGGPIGLKGIGPARSASVSLEPAGQLELSGGLVRTLHETKAELDAHFAHVRAAAEKLGIGFAPLGFHPTMRRDEMPWMPKGRYAIMRRYMPTKGQLGLDMMTRTCTVQVNLDYSSEQDMARKLRVSLALQPVATALFANSPFIEGKPSGFLSSRARVWTDTDPDRTGMPALMFQDGFGFDRYVEWLLDVPMYFVLRGKTYHDVAGGSFRSFMRKGRNSLPGVTATVGDFADHMTTVFTDVRLKRFLEMRGADAGRPEMMLAQSALWTGLLYDDAALAAADSLVRTHPWQDYAVLRATVPRLALDAPWQGGTVRELARDMVTIAADGLRARGETGPDGQDERVYLLPLYPMVEGGLTQAEGWLNRYNTVWNGDVSSIFLESAI